MCRVQDGRTGTASPSCQRQHGHSACVGELAQVVADDVAGPLTLGTGPAAQAERAGVLSELHLPEGWFDDRLSAGVVGPPLLRPQAASHSLTTGGVFWDRARGDFWNFSP